MSSMRDQWIELFKKKINYELSVLRETREYQEKQRTAKEMVISTSKSAAIIQRIEEHKQLSKELEAKAQQERNQCFALERELNDALEKYSKIDPENPWRSLGPADILQRESEKIMIQNHMVPFWERLEKLINTKNNLQTEFLLATTPTQMRNVVERLLGNLGWNTESLNK